MNLKKRCRVCGDVAICFNFNGLSCEACKVFFRRNILKNKELECKNENNCLVDKATRKFCKRCRMDKCLAIGMKKELITASKEKLTLEQTPENINGMQTKHCRVCGDKAIGFNFNVVTCESCKSFFRRHALSNEQTCTQIRKCEINESTRRNCIPCRLEKCLASGMDKNLIFSRNKHEFEKEEYQPKIIRIYKNTTDLKCHELVRLIEVRDAVTVFQEADNFTQIVESQNVLEMANVQEEFAKIAIKFCKKLSAFKNLSQPDQLILFKNFFPERCILRSAFQYDHKKDGFPVLQSDGKAIFVPLSIVKYIPQYPNAYAVLRKMCPSLNLAMENDFTIRDLISSLLLFKDRTNVSNRENIRYHYILYNYLLKRYLEHKYSNVEKANEKYHTFISLLRLLEMATEHMKCFYTNMQQQTQNPDQIAQILREIYYDS